MFAPSLFFLDVTIKATAVLLTAYVAALFLRRGPAATRHLVWSLALVALLLLPGLTLLPGWQLPWLAPWSNSQAEQLVQASAPALTAPTAVLAQLKPQSSPLPGVEHLPIPAAPSDAVEVHRVTVGEPSAAAPTTDVANVAWRLTALWAIGAACFLALLGLAFAKLRQQARTCSAVNQGPLHDLMKSLAAELGIRRRVRLVESMQRAIPMTWGAVLPSLMVPKEAAGWTPDRQRMVLLHELGHISRWDCLTHLLGQLARGLFWFHPLAWWALAKQRQEQEQACDDLVIAHGAAAHEYAEHLLTITAQLPAGYLGSSLALGITRTARLRRRLVALLDPARAHRPTGRWQRLATCCIALALLVPAASATWARAELPPEVEQAPIVQVAPEPAAQEQQAPMSPDALKQLEEIRKKLREHYVGPLDDKQLTLAAIKGLLQGLKDPYTDYLPAEELGMFESQMQGAFVGVGIQLKMDNNRLTVVTPIEGSPALKAGVRPGDQIEAIDGQPTAGINLQAAVKRILGKVGTEVKLKVTHADGVAKEMTITRAPLRIATVQGFQRGGDGRWRYLLDGEHKVGYVRITQFAPSTAKETKAALDALKKEDMKSLILDLRFCPGGMLDAAIGVCKMFVGKGELLTMKGAGKEPRVFTADGKDAVVEVPMVILLNEQTASAAEIVAGALGDHKRAMLLGTRTYGKGSVQSIVKLDDGAALKVTSAYHYLPSGRNIHKRPGEKDWGIDPNDGYYLPLTKSQVEALQKNQMERNVMGHGKDDQPKPAERVTPKVAEEQFADPQLAAALRTLVAKATGGEFIKVGHANAVMLDHLQKLEEMRLRREAILQNLQQLDRDIEAVQQAAGQKK